MPAAGVHLILLDEIAGAFNVPAAFRQIVRNHPEAARWGAIGPDYLYFYHKSV
jgi:hypothetical protein